MGWHKPDPAIVWRAVTAYLGHAYDESPGGEASPVGAGLAHPAGPHAIPAGAPSAVKARLESLRLAPAESFFASPVFERDVPTHATKYSLRLGNRFYPHMKLVIERSPDGHGHLFRADTHDAHCRPAPGSRDFHVFNQLMEKNRAVADRIEAAWQAIGVPTFKAYLRQDLERRRASQ